jgi:hypothetical protein
MVINLDVFLFSDHLVFLAFLFGSCSVLRLGLALVSKFLRRNSHQLKSVLSLEFLSFLLIWKSWKCVNLVKRRLLYSSYCNSS